MQNKRILYTNAEGGISIVVPAPDCTEDQAIVAVPEGVSYEIVDVDQIPSDRTFRDAWFHDTTNSPEKVGINIDKTKDHCHGKRRAKRAEEFAPLDIKATIPSEAIAAEAERQKVRDKYADIQNQIDAAGDVETLTSIVGALQ